MTFAHCPVERSVGSSGRSDPSVVSTAAAFKLLGVWIAELGIVETASGR